MTDSKFWLLTMDYFKKDIKKPEDNFVVFIHWLLLKNDFKVLGPGNENEIDQNEEPSDILPLNWSQNEIFKFRYVHKTILFLLHGVKAGDNLIFNFYNVSSKQVSSAAFSNISTKLHWITDMVNNTDNFLNTVNMIQKDLIGAMQKEVEDKKVASTQTQIIEPTTNSNECSLLISRTGPSGFLRNNPRNSFPSYGASDLDPLGSIDGGGMIYDPFVMSNRSTYLNEGVPSRARFDPIRPPNPDPMMPNGFRPNPDHMRPPDFDDNMFM